MNFRTLLSIFLEYETTKVLKIVSWKITLFYRTVQFVIILYISLWVMYHDKGYQCFDYPVSGVTTKLRGLAYTNITATGPQVWDVADFMVPPQQTYGFFVTTNMVITPNQTLHKCPESLDVYGATCTDDTTCDTGKLSHLGSGILTGKCVQSDQNASVSVCEVYGWCPTELDVMPIEGKPLLQTAPNFTVLLKNSIKFPKFNVKRRNILSWMNKTYLTNCIYDPNHTELKYCPRFRLQDIIKYSNAKNKNIWVYGGLISIHIEWECNLDIDIELCVPQYTFRRLDDFTFDLGKGWNFRYSHHFTEEGIEKRTLIKAYGIQCFITVGGRGRKFDPINFSMNLGSGLALLGIASVICDLVVIYFNKDRHVYKKAIVDEFDGSIKSRTLRRKIIDNYKSIFRRTGAVKQRSTTELFYVNTEDRTDTDCNSRRIGARVICNRNCNIMCNRNKL